MRGLVVPGSAPSGKGRDLTIRDALQIKAAEYWLRLGEANEALRELEKLPGETWKCGWALRTRMAALGMLGVKDEITV
jgi:hypothetical protein